MKRRKFIQLTSSGSLAGFMLNGHLVSAFTRTKLLTNISEDVIRERSIVMIQLSGGNDGLIQLFPKISTINMQIFARRFEFITLAIMQELNWIRH